MAEGSKDQGPYVPRIGDTISEAAKKMTDRAKSTGAWQTTKFNDVRVTVDPNDKPRDVEKNYRSDYDRAHPSPRKPLWRRLLGR